jgi:HPt (histidine-containing phosphotransfer) domain-containing protein
LKYAAFKLKGVAASLGLRKIASMARELEISSTELTDPVRCTAIVEQIQTDLALARELCQRLGLVG